MKLVRRYRIADCHWCMELLVGGVRRGSRQRILRMLHHIVVGGRYGIHADELSSWKLLPYQGSEEDRIDPIASEFEMDSSGFLKLDRFNNSRCLGNNLQGIVSRAVAVVGNMDDDLFLS
ncbi:hypothetical protein M569_06142 [Genlisea aurea]|uniref:Uncharacterized protein n=1 Tax=Genlisea aurea TaxID=192259 RepID=S8CUQ7_9LAMI|nr:hypothetical protein M569_06142 [Genlisea aurea]